ncbi:MAG: M18 family aminopeptidase [Muribaculaceae bacterium]|nr:M18 family aminopeptidase [Muribaculaceae bacterium]
MTAQLMDWLDSSPCNFMAVGTMIEELEENGFEPLDLSQEWEIQPGGKYYVVQNDTALFAFVAGEAAPAEGGFHVISSHSDSPGFKLKPNPEIYGDGGVVSLNVEKYGGGIMYTWFDRPLSIAARLMLRTENPMEPRSVIVDLEDPVALIPHLAIHFNRQVNDGNPLSVQKDMKPVIGTFDKDTYSRLQAMGGVVRCMLADAAEISPEDILGMEAVLYPVEKATLAGVNNEYIMSGRLDDLSMAFTSLQALISKADTPAESTRIMAVFDNEETGSNTRQGAAAPTLRNIMERITIALSGNASPENFMRAIAKSFMISADDAHAWHPNYNEKYDPTNHPVIGGGPVVKINANCKYMTDSLGDAVFSALCERAGVKCQYFVNHADVAGGSTLGNILTSQLDLAGVDMGCAIWAMHSACETAGVRDHLDTIRVFSEFFSI